MRSPYATFRLIDIHVAQRVRNLLRRRHKLARATSRFGYNEVHGGLGVIEVRRRLYIVPAHFIDYQFMDNGADARYIVDEQDF